MNPHIHLQTLDKNLCQQYLDAITYLANQIPQVHYTPEEIISDSNNDQVLLGKWHYSLILFDHQLPIGFLLAYERKAENNSQYPANSLYLSEFAIHPNYRRQGLGKLLIQEFFRRRLTQKSLSYLSGKMLFSLQTNSAEWNQHVRKLYESFGFVQRGSKSYENRLDYIYELLPP